jgi:hypothetical protein
MMVLCLLAPPIEDEDPVDFIMPSMLEVNVAMGGRLIPPSLLLLSESSFDLFVAPELRLELGVLGAGSKNIPIGMPSGLWMSMPERADCPNLVAVSARKSIGFVTSGSGSLR